MLGAIIGDIVGSKYEFNNIRTKVFPLFSKYSFFTDDSVMTLAIGKALLKCKGDYTNLTQIVVQTMQTVGRKYPDSGYGNMFKMWMFSKNPKPYNSFGNGSAMRVSACGIVGKTLEEVKYLSKTVTEVSHNHPEGIKGAEAVAVSIYFALHGKTKKYIYEYINKHYYRLDFTLDSIRETYRFNETCQGTVPQALVAFFESKDFEDAIKDMSNCTGELYALMTENNSDSLNNVATETANNTTTISESSNTLNPFLSLGDSKTTTTNIDKPNNVETMHSAAVTETPA
ncbi:MAG TPA: ADP-ribosylglycohydrolase family protein, partial [Bacillota bacterium]|nr:ADP-ribosylglycohydrolase family protein [Bacillota bacterium]